MLWLFGLTRRKTCRFITAVIPFCINNVSARHLTRLFEKSMWFTSSSTPLQCCSIMSVPKKATFSVSSWLAFNLEESRSPREEPKISHLTQPLFVATFHWVHENQPTNHSLLSRGRFVFWSQSIQCLPLNLSAGAVENVFQKTDPRATEKEVVKHGHISELNFPLPSKPWSQKLYANCSPVAAYRGCSRQKWNERPLGRLKLASRILQLEIGV